MSEDIINTDNSKPQTLAERRKAATGITGNYVNITSDILEPKELDPSLFQTVSAHTQLNFLNPIQRFAKSVANSDEYKELSQESVNDINNFIQSSKYKEYLDAGVSSQQMNTIIQNSDSVEEVIDNLNFVLTDVIPEDQVVASSGVGANLLGGIASELPTILVGGGLVGATAKVVTKSKSLSNAIKATNLAGQGKGKAAVRGFGAGVSEGIIYTAKDDLANFRGYDASDYASQAVIEGLAFGAINGLLAKSSNVKTSYDSLGEPNGTKGGNTVKFKEASPITEVDAKAVTEDGVVRASMEWTGDITAKNMKRGLVDSIKGTRKEIKKVSAEIEELKARIETEAEIAAKKENDIVTQRAPDIAKAEKNIKFKTQAGVDDNIKSVFSTGRVTSASTEELTSFIENARGEISSSTGVDVIPNSKVKATRDAIANANGDTKLYDAINSADKLIKDANAKKTIEDVNAMIDAEAAAAKAEHVDNIKRSKKTLDILEKRREKLTENLNETRGKVREIATKGDDEVIDVSMDKFLYFKASIGKGKDVSKQMSAKAYGDIRKVAEELDDKEVLDALEGVDLGGFSGKDLSSTIIDVVAEGEKLSGNAGRLNSAFGRFEKYVLTTGAILNSSSSDMIRGLGARLMSNNIGNVDKSVSRNAGSVYVENLKQEFEGKINQVFANRQVEYMNLKGKKIMLDTTKAYNAGTKEALEFNDILSDALHDLNFKTDLSEYPKPVADAAFDVQRIISDMRLKVLRAHPNMTKELFDQLKDETTKSVLSRIRNNDFYRETQHLFNVNDHIDIHEGSIIKGIPWINHSMKLSTLKDKSKKTKLDDGELAEVARLEKRIDELKAMREDSKLIDEQIENLIQEARKEGTYSRMIGKAYYKNQLTRANGGAVAEKAYGSEDILKFLEDAEVLESLTEQERKQVKLFAENNKAVGRSEFDPFQSRMNLDISYSKEVTGVDGKVANVSMSMYYQSHAHSTLMQMTAKYAGLFGVRKSGIGTSLDDLDKAIDEARKEIVKLPESEREIVSKSLDVTQNYYKAQGQYDRSQSYWAAIDTIKNMTAATKLGYLFLGVMTEGWNIIAYNGVPNALKAVGATSIAQKMRRGELSMNDGMGALYIAAGNSLDPLRNQLSRTDTGINDISGKVSFMSRARDKAATYARYTNHLNEGIDVNLRAINFQAGLNSLLNSKVSDLKSQFYKDHGITDELADQILSLESKGYVKRDKSGNIVDFEYKRMYDDNAEFAEEFVASLSRVLDRAIQTTRVSDIPPWMNTATWSMLGQFKTFMIASYSNQLRYGVTRPSLKTGAMFTGQLAMSYMLYVARTMYDYQNDKKMRDKLLSPEIAFFAAIRGTGWGALMSTALGTGFSFTGYNPFAYGSKTGQDVSNASFESWLSSNTLTRFVNDAAMALSTGVNITLGGKPSEYETRKALGLIMPTTILGPSVDTLSNIFEIDKRQKNALQETLTD